MEHVDGNAVAGPLAEFFAFDVTTAVARCAGCGQTGELARAMAWRTDAGTVLRCPTCDDVLATFVVGSDRAWIGFSGISAMEVRRASGT